ncbi:MAG: hypothetical protein ACYDCD_06040 [Candidatus Acidiferrales bacterium]
MAGVYGEINSRIDYHRVLGEARDIARRILARSPEDGTMKRIDKQLEAMRRWTDNGREPSESERRNIDVGLVAARELSEVTDEVGDLAGKLYALNNYFEDWPTDAEAANATEDDFFDAE